MYKLICTRPPIELEILGAPRRQDQLSRRCWANFQWQSWHHHYDCNTAVALMPLYSCQRRATVAGRRLSCTDVVSSWQDHLAQYRSAARLVRPVLTHSCAPAASRCQFDCSWSGTASAGPQNHQQLLPQLPACRSWPGLPRVSTTHPAGSAPTGTRPCHRTPRHMHGPQQMCNLPCAQQPCATPS